MRPSLTLLTFAAAVALAATARADEGMWTYDAFPSDAVERAYGFRPDAAWLERVRLASARLAGGCSASFVSPGGLVMTNHHCVHTCVEQLSTASEDLVHGGFLARAPGEERRCPEMEVNQLVGITDVSDRIRAATAGKEGKPYLAALRAEQATIEKACETSAAVRCEVVELYGGAVQQLYTYRRWQDVRLVFAPEFQIAFFGGDPDNFEFPRWNLDAAFVRVYADGKPAATPHFFPWSAAGAKEGELVFVSGHPGGTDRALTVAQLEYQRDVALPVRLARLAELRGLLTGFQLLGPEEKRTSTAELFYVENSLKVIRGRLQALSDRAFMARKLADEAALRAELARDPALAASALPAFDAIARAQVRLAGLRAEHDALERGFDSDLVGIARKLMRAGDEAAKPPAERLREYRDSNRVALEQAVLSTAPVYPKVEKLLLAFGLTKLRESLGPDHPAVRRILGRESPEELAARVVAGTKLADVEVRRALWKGGAAAIREAERTDPLLALARLVDPDARAIRATYEAEVEAVVKKAQEQLTAARFAARGRSTYPDATFTLRLSYGAVAGWREGGRTVPPFTTIAGTFDRATGRPPFDLPASWLAAKDHLAGATPFNLATTNDIIGGNSGSPLVNRAGEIVGLVFDGNIHSLPGNYAYDPALNRTVAVHSDAIVEALRTVYRADALVGELLPRGRRGAGTPRASP